MSKSYSTVSSLDGPQTNYRFEKKYQVPTTQLLRYRLNFISHGFVLHHQPRNINNLYIDNFRLDAFQENLEGLSDRAKARFRWYGSQFGNSNIVAEVKIKSDDVNRKESISLGNYEFRRLQDIDKLYQKLLKDLGQEHASQFNDYSPSLLNRYLREYYYHPLSNVRITLDHERWYYNPRTLKSAIDDQTLVVEIKSAVENPFTSIDFPVLLGKSSKYCAGIELTSW